MTTVELLTFAQRSGIVLTAGGDTLTVDAPAGALTPELRAAVADRKADLLAVLWRLDAMRRLAIVAPRAVVYARETARGGPGHCFSCGDPLEHPAAYGRCTPCDVASDVYYATVPSPGDRSLVV